MDERDTALLSRASDEISQLPRRNEIMSARLQMFDSIMLLFNSTPNYPGVGASPDIVWEIKKHIEENKSA